MNQNKSLNTSQRTTVTQHDIATAAYYHWLKAGQPGGRDLEFWVKAEMELKGTAAGGKAAEPAKGGGARMLPSETPAPTPVKAASVPPATARTAAPFASPVKTAVQTPAHSPAPTPVAAVSPRKRATARSNGRKRV